jgi:hypothetical protein
MIGFVIIGALLGYSFSFIEKENIEENIKTDEVVTSITPLQNTPSESITPRGMKVQAAIVENDSHLTHQQTKTIAKALNQDHIDLIKVNLDLVEQHQRLKDKYIKSKNKANLLELQLNEYDGSKATDEEMEALAPEPFKQYLSSFRGETRNNILDFHYKEDDVDWGYDTKNNISDFILTHYEGTNIGLISVTCKQPYCEILVIEKQKDAWNKIIKDMTQQPWWTFSSTTSSSNNESTYIFLSK